MVGNLLLTRLHPRSASGPHERIPEAWLVCTCIIMVAQGDALSATGMRNSLPWL